MAAAQATVSVLSFVQAAHVFAVFHAMLEKLSLIGAIRVDPQEQAEALTRSVGEEITHMLEQQKQLEDKFQTLLAEQHILRSLPNKNKLMQNEAQLHEVAEQLRHSTAQLCRNLKDNPNVSENMVKVAAERNTLQQLLQHCSHELEAQQQAPALAEFVVNQERRDVDIRDTIERERITSAAVKQLKATIREESAKHEEELRANKRSLKALNTQLKQITLDSHSTQQYRELEVKASNECGRRVESMAVADLRDEAELLRQQIALEERVHQTSADFLGKQAKQLREDALNWADRLEKDVTAKERDTEALKQEHQRDTSRLKDVKEAYEDEVTAKEERDTCEKEVKDRVAAELVLLERQAMAVLRIQAMWRGHAARQSLSKEKKGKGATKGKGPAKKKNAVLMTLLAGWDASPRDVRAAIAWGVISTARHTHLQAGTLHPGAAVLGWQAAGLVLIVLPRLPPVKARANSMTIDFQDPEYEPVTLHDVCGTPPTTPAAVSALLVAPLTPTIPSVQTVLAWLPCCLLHCMLNMAAAPGSWAAGAFIAATPHRRQIACLIRLARRRLSLQDISHGTLGIVPFNLVVYLGPVGALTTWTAMLLAAYTGFMHATWQLLTLSTPTLARDPWAGALHLGSLAAWPAWAWGWAPMLCWAASILYSFNIVRQLGVRVATLQNRVSAVEGREAQLVGMVQPLEGTVTILEDRVMYLEDRLKVAELRSGAAVAGDPVPTRIAASAIIPADPAQAQAELPINGPDGARHGRQPFKRLFGCSTFPILLVRSNPHVPT
eukprot:jgi/Astpho2/8098/Aster-03042